MNASAGMKMVTAFPRTVLGLSWPWALLLSGLFSKNRGKNYYFMLTFLKKNFNHYLSYRRVSLIDQLVKNLPSMQETLV